VSSVMRRRIEVRTAVEVAFTRPAIQVLVLLLPIAATAAGPADAVRGERVFQRCYACHSVDPNEKVKLQGPSLYRIMGRPAAAIPGFEYSDAMRSKGTAGLVWDAPTLDRYIADPESLVAGTNMSVPPLRDEQERADLLAYLGSSGPYRP
jgi:cytochrome c